MDYLKPSLIERLVPWVMGAVALAFVVLIAAVLATPSRVPATPRLEAAPAPPAISPAEQARAEAIELLGAAGSMRQAGDLGIAVELARQAVAKSPDYAEAQTFLKEVEAQKKAAEDAAARVAKEASERARNNGWSSDESHALGMHFWRHPNTSMLAALCAEQTVVNTVPRREYERLLRDDWNRLEPVLGAALQRCQRNALDIPLR